MQTLRSLACGVAIGASAAVCLAGSASSFFQVSITLHTVAPVFPGLPADPPPSGGGGGSNPLPVVPPVAPPIAPPGVPPAVPGPFPVQPGLPVADAGAGGGLPIPPPPVLSATVPPNGICSSQASGATVRVVCSSGQFVSIDAVPGQPFALTHGGTYRFSFGPGLPLPALASTLGLNIGAGTVTALRILSVSSGEAPLEMLVSF